jgi:hypothetical protein
MQYLIDEESKRMGRAHGCRLVRSKFTEPAGGLRLRETFFGRVEAANEFADV